MSITLGAAWPNQPLPEPVYEPDPMDLRLELVLTALEQLRDGLNLLPAPQVTIDAPDLSAVVNAVNGLRPGVIDADEIGQAVAKALIPMSSTAADPVWQDKLIKALEKLDFRMKGLGGGGGHGFIPDITDRVARQLGVVTVANPGTDPETGLAKDVTLSRRFAANSARVTGAAQVTAIGSNTVYTPAAGKLVRLHWVGMSSSQNNAGETLAIVQLGSKVLYRWNLGNPGAFSHFEIADGAVNSPLTVNLSAAYPVEMNYTVEEV